jgi:hypothetical protein
MYGKYMYNIYNIIIAADMNSDITLLFAENSGEACPLIPLEVHLARKKTNPPIAQGLVTGLGSSNS